MPRATLTSLLLLAACAAPATDRTAAPEDPAGLAAEAWCPAGTQAIEADIDRLLADLTLEEKIDQLAGTGSVDGIWGTAGIARHDVVGFQMVDGPRGVSAAAGAATAFPVGMARGASWDPSLEREIGGAIGEEAAARGANVLLAPTMNILRHPSWGRAQETYGEDPHHMGAMATAFVQGAQQHVLASAKHYALNSIEDTRFSVDVTVDERALREVYLPHFEQVVRDGQVGTVMTAYNSVNGDWASENAPLLSILNDDWHFQGVVVSDWVFGTRSAVASLEAGLTLEMPLPLWLGERALDAVEDGDLDVAFVDAAVRRSLRARLCHSLGQGTPPPTAVLESEAHLDLARQAAVRGMVLLRNEGALPLPADAQVVLAGPLADIENIGDEGSSQVAPTDVVTLAEGLEAALGDGLQRVGEPPYDADTILALNQATAVVVAVGLDAQSEGESLISAGDRPDLALPADQASLLAAIAPHTDRLVVVLEGGSAVTHGWDLADALLMAWYPGAQGGHAITDVLFGTEPGGRLPLTWPTQASDLPPFDNTSEQVTYDRWHGYTHLARTETAARFPFGYGLSYTTWRTDDASVTPAAGTAEDTVSVTVTLTNTGSSAGRRVVQLYASPPADDPHDHPARILRGFASTDLATGASERMQIDLPLSQLRRWDHEAGWVVDPGLWTLTLADHAEDPGLPLTVQVR